MRTTLDLDDDVLATGSIMRNGICRFPVRPGAGPVTSEIVQRLVDA